jgi:hypothetical protein
MVLGFGSCFVVGTVADFVVGVVVLEDGCIDFY